MKQAMQNAKWQRTHFHIKYQKINIPLATNPVAYIDHWVFSFASVFILS